MEWTEKKINDIVDLKDKDGNQLDIFNLHGVLYVGNAENGKWDLSKRYVMYSEHSIPISLDDFEFCENDEEVNEKFGEVFKEAVMNKLM